MTINEARYVVAHRELYPVDMYLWAVDIIESFERQRPHSLDA